MKYKIYKPSKSAMQSGLNNTKKWCIELIDFSEKQQNQLGWSSSDNTYEQVKLFFESLESAESFAKKNNMEFEVLDDHKRKILKKTYADNFKPKKRF